ncbi:MAG: hypothetical protein H0T92_20865, partial [Pyrinomonadaceae bacterium]|nr:hypothetical protein [Pyrinomonadaceae bacterium]
PGFGRIDILTKPGTDKLRGSAFLNMSDEKLNSRNPFAPERAPYMSRLYGGTLSGTVIPKRASFFLDFQRRDIDENGVVNAQVLDSSLNPTVFPFTLVAPTRNTTFSPRFDYQLNTNNTLVGRYTFTRSSLLNQGVSELSLPERAYSSMSTQHSFQLTETAILGPRFINETRFQFVRDRRRQDDPNLAPTIIVQDSFLGGGAGVGLSFNASDRYELQNYTTATLGKHILRFSVRLRGITITDFSPGNFTGTFNFAGGSAPQLDADNEIIRDASGNSVFASITSLERYRRTLLLQRQGLAPVVIRERGGGASQFSINGGNPQAGVRQIDFGGFVQDEWRLRPNFTLTLGLRYEAQNNLDSRFNFAPRVFFAWAPGGKTTGTFGNVPGGGGDQPKFVIRAGFGMFYDRFNESNTLQANRFDGVNQVRYNVSDPAVLDSFPSVPTIEELNGFAQRQTTTRIAPTVRAPYSLHYVLSIERQLPYKITAFVFAFNYRTLHSLRLRNINAPLPETIVRDPDTGRILSAARPFGNVGEIFQVESSGNSNFNQMASGIRAQVNPGFSLNVTYVLSKAKSDTDYFPFGGGFGGGSFPASSYDLRGEYGRGIFDQRHRLFFGGTVTIPRFNVVLNPFGFVTTGRPFNITTGRDTNGDQVFTERPALATARTEPSNLRRTPFGDFDLNPAPGQAIIPRNYGQGPAFFSVNLGINRTVGFGEVPQPAAATAVTVAPQTTPPTGTTNNANGARRRAPIPKRYNVTFGVQMFNIFNRANLAQPIGNLSSPIFGQTTGTRDFFGNGGGSSTPAFNRRIEAQVRFNF